ncbi:glycoside hydrolase [Pelagophyceae sp. CCMP2097]|nr:glycoside hydrolase [Pelagophyceae sp. CCMP2097]
MLGRWWPCIWLCFAAHALTTAENEVRRDAVRGAVRECWRAYRASAAGYDDVAPKAGKGLDWLHSRATFFDSLDTLYVVGLKSDFDAAVAEVVATGASRWRPPYWARSGIRPVKVFEYHIRVVGGLLGAYAVSGDRALLYAGRDAADAMLRGWRASNGVARRYAHIVDRRTAPVLAWVLGVFDDLRAALDPAAGCNSLAGAGSFGLELNFLSRELGDPAYAARTRRVHDVVYRRWRADGGPRSKTWLPLWWQSLPPDNVFGRLFAADVGANEWPTCEGGKASLGSGGDSFYEYLLKEHLQLNAMASQPGERAPHDSKTASEKLAMYEWLVDGLASALPLPESHLGCFVGGLLALGAARNVHTGPMRMERAARDLESAAGVADRCLAAYAATASSLGPDEFGPRFRPAGPGAAHKLRPELVESLFVLYRVTRDERWRDAAWRIFQKWVEHCRVEQGGFSGLLDVNAPGSLDDEQPSYFLAESLKYMYLLFSDTDEIGLEEYVFTTEGHPLTLAPRCGGPDDCFGGDFIPHCVLPSDVLCLCALFVYYLRRCRARRRSKRGARRSRYNELHIV